MASWKLRIATQFVHVLPLYLNINKMCPLTRVHIPSVENALTDIPSYLFGSIKEWECKTDSKSLTLFNQKNSSPQPWIMDSLPTMQIEGITLAEWQRLPKIGKHIGETGPNMSDLWDWTLSYRGCGTGQECVSSQGLHQEFAGGSMGEGSKSRLERSLALSRPLDRRLRWPAGKTPQK
jgi:hypothetical protein